MPTIEMDLKNRTGILGGSFNPFHNGHLRHALEACECLGLKKVILSPCARPAHKDVSGLLPFELRARCIESAICDIPSLELSVMEEAMEGFSYTYEVLKAWQEEYKEEPLFLLGLDDLTQLHSWYRGMDIPEQAHLVVISRNNLGMDVFFEYVNRYWPGSLSEEEYQVLAEVSPALAKGLPVSVGLKPVGVCTFLHIPFLEICASQVREYWQKGRCLDGLVPLSVQRILIENTPKLKKYWL